MLTKMLKLYPRNAHVICWIIIGSFILAQGSNITVMEGEDVIIECGLQTKVEEGYLRWQAITNNISEELAYNLRDGIPSCDDRIISCTLHANGSIQLESVSKEDGARYYRCLRGDKDGYNYFSDHRLLVLSKESPSISQSPTSAIAFKASRKDIVHSYGEPVCEDDVDGNPPVVCYPKSGIIVDREYENIQCNCTDSDGLMDSVIFHVTRKMSSPPSIETPHRESVSSYNMGKKGLLHGYHAPICEDDVDGNLPVVCYPPSGITVDREYETIQCNCTDSDGLMDSVTFPVTSKPHGLHLFWIKEYTLLVISILIMMVVVLSLLCCYLYKNKKQLNANRAASDREEMTHIHSGTKDKQITDLMDTIATLKARLNNSQTELTEREKEVIHLKKQLEQKERQEAEIKNKLEEQHKKIIKIEKDLAVKEAENIGLGKRQEDSQQQASLLEKILANYLTTEKIKNSKGRRQRKAHSTPGTPGKNNRNDQDVVTDIDDSDTTEDNENAGKDETDFFQV